jgi:hypothetical protein
VTDTIIIVTGLKYTYNMRQSQQLTRKTIREWKMNQYYGGW